MKNLKFLQMEACELVRHLSPTGIDNMDKYLNATLEVDQKFKLVEALGLKKTDAPMCFLDISTGAGWLPWILHKCTHDVRYTDNLAEPNPITRLIRESLGLKNCIDFAYHRIPKKQRSDVPDLWEYEPIPSFGRKFDGIFACSVQPHSHFSREQMITLIDDAMGHLEPFGFFYLAINRGSGMDTLDALMSEGIYKADKKLKGWRIDK